MPSIVENLQAWDEKHDWKRAGDEWSEAWGGPDAQWYGTILPRIHSWVPCNTILEIAPGFGRWTRYLKELCRQLIIVDLSQRCIEACKRRFANDSNILYFVNDGCSLTMVGDASIDFAFSFDSLVHADANVLHSYLRELARKLTQEGIAFIHHSNMGSYRRRLSVGVYLERVGRLHGLFRRPIDILAHRCELINKCWRSLDVSAESIREIGKGVGLVCVTQEILAWGGTILNDCISVLARPNSKWAGPTRTYRNEHFMKEVLRVRQVAQFYGRSSL